MSARSIKRLHPALRDDIGDLMTSRPLPGPAIDQLDPFLFLNHHGPQTYPPANSGLPFAPHPHRGFETVTFILEGELAHRDSGGHESIIAGGGVQWMTAGSGVVHSELSPERFRQQGGPLEILQLWVNLPSKLKMTQPNYTGLQKQDIPAISTDQGRITVNLIAGTWNGHSGPIQSLTDVHMATVQFASGGRVGFAVEPGRNVFLYIVRGTLNVSGQPAGAFTLVELDNDGDTVELEAQEDALVLFGHAMPLGEPVVAHGPFVMNSREEIMQAIRDFQDGKLGGL